MNFCYVNVFREKYECLFVNVFRENATEGRKIDVLQLMLDASEVTQSSEADTVSTKKLLSDDEIVANSWIFLLGHFHSPYFKAINVQSIYG
jgi:hypothetical protein